tara:strand:+ start:208 stop:750 length:543 start_codon:yes stop_codon:yes gene_type:complete
MQKINLLITIFLILACGCSEENTAPTVTKYKQFIVSEQGENIILKSKSNKIVAIIHDSLLDSQSVFVGDERNKTHELFRIKYSKWMRIYVSTINSVPEKILKQKIDELDKNIFKIIVVQVDVDINISRIRSFIHNVGDADLKIAIIHTNLKKDNIGNILYWDEEIIKKKTKLEKAMTEDT